MEFNKELIEFNKKLKFIMIRIDQKGHSGAADLFLVKFRKSLWLT